VPETRAYRISASAELFPQHCQVPNLSKNAHLKALTEELDMTTSQVAQTHKGRALIKALGKAIKAILHPTAAGEQRVDNNIRVIETQRANEDMAPITRTSDAPAIMRARDPTAKRNLIKDTHTHRSLTRNNTPGAVPVIQRVAPALILPDKQPARATRRSPRVNTNEGPVIIIPPYRMLGGGTRASPRLVSQQALNAMTMREAITPPMVFTLRKFLPITYEDNPTTGEAISSYKRLMNDPVTAEVWQTAFGKDFGGMAQGDNKTGQKGTNSVFVMTHKEIDIAKNAGHKWTYARVVVDYRPQKEDPNRIRIAVGGNLITY